MATIAILYIGKLSAPIYVKLYLIIYLKKTLWCHSGIYLNYDLLMYCCFKTRHAYFYYKKHKIRCNYGAICLLCVLFYALFMTFSKQYFKKKWVCITILKLFCAKISLK